MNRFIKSVFTSVLLALLVTTSVPAAAMSNWIRKEIKYSEFSAAATTGNVAVYYVPANTMVEAAVFQLNTAFSGGAVSACTISLGTSASATRYTPAYDVFTGAATSPQVVIAQGVEAQNNVVRAYMTTTSANTSALTAGKITVYLLVAPLPPGATLGADVRTLVNEKFGSDLTFITGLSGGADISVDQAASATAASTLNITGQQGGPAATGGVGKNGGAVRVTGGAGTTKNGAGATDGDGADVVLTGGARGGTTGGTEVQGIVRVGSPTVDSTKTVDLLAVGGGLEVDGAARFDGTASFNSTTTFQTGDIIATEIADITRAVQLPIGAWGPCADQGVWAVDGADSKPNLTSVNSALAITYDVTGGSPDTGTICTSFVVPPDYVSGGAFVAVVTQGGATATQTETWSCNVSYNGGALVGANAVNLVNQTAVQTVTSTPVVSYVAGGSVGAVCSQGNASADDVVNILAVRWTYTASE